jgi:hypothetical protein
MSNEDFNRIRREKAKHWREKNPEKARARYLANRERERARVTALRAELDRKLLELGRK